MSTVIQEREAYIQVGLITGCTFVFLGRRACKQGWEKAYNWNFRVFMGTSKENLYVGIEA